MTKEEIQKVLDLSLEYYKSEIFGTGKETEAPTQERVDWIYEKMKNYDMWINIYTLDGEKIKSIPTSLETFDDDIEEVKRNYPPGQYHAKLQTY